jgi:site-specific recombinase XerC
MQLTRLTRHASHVIPVTSNTPNHHTGTTIQAADAYSDHDRSIATRISLNTGSARTSHNCASSLYARGLDLKAIQDILGHEWLSTTTRYIHVHDAHTEKAWTAANARVAGRLEIPEG